MIRSETTTIDPLCAVPLERSSSQLYNEKPLGKTADLCSTIPTRLLVWSPAPKNPPSSTILPTEPISTRAELPLISGFQSVIAADHEGCRTTFWENAPANSDVGNEEKIEISGDSLNAPQHLGITTTPVSSQTPLSSFKSEVTTSTPGTIASVGLSSISSSSSADLCFGEAVHKNACSIRVTKHPDDPFREPVQIPGCSPTIFVYPHSSAVIGAEFHERYREVVNVFRHNTEEHPQLRENVQYIDYNLKLCGTSSGASYPSILVFCRQSEFKALNVIFTRKELKYQYCLRRSSRKYLWSGSQAPIIEEDHRPFFNLYFWRQRRPRTLFWGQESVRIHRQLNMSRQLSETRPCLAPELTMCGCMVKHIGSRSSFSTLGCVIKIASEFYAITSMHAFKPFDLSKTAHRRKHSSASADEVAGLPVYEDNYNLDSYINPSHAIFEDDDYLINDVKYESLAEDEEDDIDAVDSNPIPDYCDYGNQIQTVDQTSEIKDLLLLLPTPLELSEYGQEDLDWALVKLMDRHNWRPNAFISPGISSSPVFLSKVAESQPNQETPVLIISGKTVPQSGMLQPGTSILGGINGKALSTVWTAVLCKQGSLGKGDSGSIVVDAETYVIYGHIIGSNPIGEVYISPYAAIFDQIREQFPGSPVSIPEPISTLADLIDFYTTITLDESGLESLERLRVAYWRASAGETAAIEHGELRPISPDSLQLHPFGVASDILVGHESTPRPYNIPSDQRFNRGLKPTAVAGTAQANAPSALLASAGTNTFLHKTTTTARDVVTSTVNPQSQPFAKSASSRASHELPSSPADRISRHTLDAVRASYNAIPSATSSILIRRLPLKTTEESLRHMTSFSKGLLNVEVLPMNQSEDNGFLSAILRFQTSLGAQEAKNILDGKPNVSNGEKMIVEMLDTRPILDRKFPGDISNHITPVTSSGVLYRQTSRFTGASFLADSTSPPRDMSPVDGWHPMVSLEPNKQTMQYEHPEVCDLRETLECCDRRARKYVDFTHNLNECTWNDVYEELRKACEQRAKTSVRQFWHPIRFGQGILALGFSAPPDHLRVLHGGLALIFCLARHSEMNRNKILAAFETIPDVIGAARNMAEIYPTYSKDPGSIQLHDNILELQTILLQTLPVLINILLPGTFVNIWKSPFAHWRIDKLLNLVSVSTDSVRSLTSRSPEAETIQTQLDEVLRQQRMIQMSIDAAHGKTHLLRFLMEQLDFNTMDIGSREPVPISDMSMALPVYKPENLLKILNVNHLPISNDMAVVIRQGQNLAREDIGQAVYIMTTPQVKELLRNPGPSVIAIDSQFDHTQIGNVSPLSYLCAMLSYTLRQQTQKYTASIGSGSLISSQPEKGVPHSVVLEYFCALHTTDEDDLQGPQGLMRFLTTQLILSLVAHEWIGHADPVLLPHLRDGEEQLLRQLKLDAVCRLFVGLIHLVPQGVPIYCFVDCWSVYECKELWREDYDIVLNAFREANDAGYKDGGASFKLLLTSPTAYRWLGSSLIPGKIVSLGNWDARDVNWRGAGNEGMIGLEREANTLNFKNGFGSGFRVNDFSHAWMKDNHS